MPQLLSLIDKVRLLYVPLSSHPSIQVQQTGDIFGRVHLGVRQRGDSRRREQMEMSSLQEFSECLKENRYLEAAFHLDYPPEEV
mmetsp:Transcript_21437/g.15657  ORF Transcript_21437/g.15657 Transcript_21437/m.15657 type:complete len:84 (+) Transcript_21437:278-529(+)